MSPRLLPRHETRHRYCHCIAHASLSRYFCASLCCSSRVSPVLDTNEIMRGSRVKHIGAAAGFAAAKPLKNEERAPTSAAAALKQLLSPNSREKTPDPSPDSSQREGGNRNQTSSRDFADKLEGETILSSSWFLNTSPRLFQQKEVRKERKAKWVIKNTQTRRFDRLVRMCAQKLGTESTFKILSKLGRETGIKECNSLIRIYIDEAKNSKNKEESLIQIQKIFGLFEFINEEGLQYEEDTYHPLFMYLIGMKMTQEFHLFMDLVRKGNSLSTTGLGYYEMLLYIKVNDKGKIQDLCNGIDITVEDGYGLAENYLLAFCDTDSKAEITKFLEMFGVRKITSFENTMRIFTSFGRLSLANLVEDFVLALRKTGMVEEDVSSIICCFVICLPNLSVEEIVSKFSFFHQKLKVIPCSNAYEKLIEFSCNAAKVNAAVDIFKKMYYSGLVPSSKIVDLILWTIEHNGEFDLVYSIYSIIRQINLVPGDFAVKSLINLLTRMGDFLSAHNLFEDLKEVKKTPTASMYNALMAGYFRKDDIRGALMVVKLMEDAAVERDAETFSYLIANCLCEEHILKYHEEMKQSGVKATRQVFMALINAYANVGRFEKAKQIILDKAIPEKHLNEIMSVLISALATNGEVSNALDVYKEMKQGGRAPQAKAICTLIEYIRTEGKVEILLQLLEELAGSKYWFDATGRVFLYCVRYNILNSAVELLRQMKDVDEIGLYTVINQAFSQLWEQESANLEFGMQLLQAVKELGLHPSRASLDFILSCCIKARNSRTAQIIWSEYRKFDLPFNVLTNLRMYQVLLASGEFSEARRLLKRIQKDDPHICLVLDACDATYRRKASSKS